MPKGKTPREWLYENAKADAKDRLGGERAYWIAGPSIRRMAVADALLTVLTSQDDSVRDDTVRSLMTDLYDLLTSDKEFQ